MAERFAPIVLLHPEERYFPLSLALYFDHLNTPKDEVFMTSGREAFLRGEAAAAVAQVSSDQRYIQYWFFYPKNGCQGMQMDFRPWTWPWEASAPPVRQTFEACQLAIHEGDWEHVTLQLSADLQKVEQAYLAQHDSGHWLTASQLEFAGDRVQLYAALNSHATYEHSSGFAAAATIDNAAVKALTWIEVLRVGDIVTTPLGASPLDGVAPPPASPQSVPWDTAAHLVVWNEGIPSPYRGYLGPWGLPVEARSVPPIAALPSYLSQIVQTVVPVVFALVPDLRDKSRGEAPPSPWGRVSWANFDRDQQQP